MNVQEELSHYPTLALALGESVGNNKMLKFCLKVNFVCDAQGAVKQATYPVHRYVLLHWDTDL